MTNTCNLKTFINSYNLLTNKKKLKSGKWLKLIFLYKTVRNILYYLSTDHISVRNKINNRQIRLGQFTDHTKNAKKYKLVGITLSINYNTKSPQT